ncbi:hypothetical protein HRbin40_00985 [bacterium HR40]|nr:hypothetical protein HRbin40_00985 [bacterium HR40]
MIVEGGKAVYGAQVGILLLEARFPRLPGDVGHAATWPFPVLYRVVPGATPERVVRHRAEGLLEAFVAAGRELVAAGADGIVTNCGFLVLQQQALQAALSVPVATSSLLQVPLVQALLPPGRRVGILTISAEDLSADHLRAAGVPVDAPVVGCPPEGEFARAILGDRPTMDIEAAEHDLLVAADRLVRCYPEVAAIVLECTNMCPFAAAIARQVARPVFDMVSLVCWFRQGLAPRRHFHREDLAVCSTNRSLFPDPGFP